MMAGLDRTREAMMAQAASARGGNQAAEYIAKYGRDERWGQSSEMTRHYAKQGASGERDGLLHFTPFQLLTWAGNGDEWSIRKFIEYSKAIEGKRAVTWSPGLKDSIKKTLVELLKNDPENKALKHSLALLKKEREDKDIADDDSLMPEQIHVGDLHQEQYQTLFRHNRLPDFIRYVADSARCQEDLDDYVNAIKMTPATHSGAVVIRGAFAGRYMVQ